MNKNFYLYASAALAGLFLALVFRMGGTQEVTEIFPTKTITQIAGEQVAPHVLKLEARDSSNRILGTGTGFYVMYNYYPYILTNKHMCEDFKEAALIESPVGSVVLTARMRFNVSIEGKNGNLQILKISKDHDLCLLRSDSMQGLELAESEVKQFDSVTVTGHPRGLPLTIRHGSVISHERTVFQWISSESVRYIMIDMIAYGGNSGSPITNSEGKVVGVLFGGFLKEHTEAFVVPLTDIKLFLYQFSLGR